MRATRATERSRARGWRGQGNFACTVPLCGVMNRNERGVTFLTTVINAPWLGACGQKGAASMTTNTAVKTSEWVERARALAPVVEQWRDAGEQERHVPRPLFEALRDACMFRMSAPKAVGGAEADE